MGNPNLTKILFAGLIMTFVTMILISNYANFAVTNNASIEETYQSIFYNISNSSDDFKNISFAAKNQSIIRSILDFGADVTTGSINIFVTGLEAVGTFFEMIPIFGSILAAISLGIPELSALITLITLILGVYISMRYIQSASNKSELP